MDFRLTEEQLSFQEMFRDITNKEIRPLAERMDREDYFSEELWQTLAETGMFGLTIPEEYNGSNVGFMVYALAMEEACRGAGTMFNWLGGTNGTYTQPILKYGTEEQKQKYVAASVIGAKKGAFALTEPNAGSDAGSLQSKAVLTGDHYVLNGTKTFITNADRADYFITFARCIQNSEDKGIIALIVDRDAPGLSVGKHEPKMGQHGTGLCEVIYQDCIVPVENVIGKPGQGLAVATSCLNEGRMCVAASAVGMAQEAIDLAVDYAKNRTQFGKRLSQFQNTQFVLAEMQTKVDAARLLTYRAASELDYGNEDKHLASMAKYYASEIANDVARKCLQVFGGYGYISEYPIERIYRDVKITEIFDGTSEIHKLLISKWMGLR